ncbi:hypothetical protein SETIT_8G221300v2 [Setaria italica]|uniref:Uncharacterized protein n=1 Tax=Setaria italica TaxID=4555 RepID=A0A368SAK6_SETIT|nr:hypothetical protein SETIT_8G221300v2 [Setaria italica]
MPLVRIGFSPRPSAARRRRAPRPPRRRKGNAASSPAAARRSQLGLALPSHRRAATAQAMTLALSAVSAASHHSGRRDAFRRRLVRSAQRPVPFPAADPALRTFAVTKRCRSAESSALQLAE